ncbi:MAG TPA: AAA family ATPase, partial [Gaiellales bacterium]
MISCPSCGHENPEAARFCNGCGAALRGAEPPREVRKTVTIVFCDVVGSTELATRYDPEVLRGVMARFYAAVREPVQRHGGTVEKVIGDALVAVFGMPVVREDDALRAVRAALEMRDAVRALGEVAVRIGVNTGDVLARDATAGESLVVGEAVNVAARLEQAAGAGEVLVGEATWALVGHAAQGERAEPILAKGTPEPLVAWRLQDVDPGARGHRRRLDLPVVGREAELDALRWALERAETGRAPHLVTVLGQAGIGKSRLVAEVRRLRPGLTVLTGQCRATTGRSSLEPVLEAARAAFAGQDPAQAVAALMPGDADAAAVADCLTRSDAGTPDIAWAVSRLVGAMSSERTVVLVLEDLHWADDAVLDVVSQLLGRGRRRALVVLATARPEFAERRPGFGAGANAVSITLDRLDDSQTRLLLTHAGPDLAPAEIDRITGMAEGNPLFAEHLAALVGDDDASAGLPRSIQVLLTARLEALPQPDREVVTVAAVAGREFPAAAVEALVGRPIAAELDHLAVRELIEPTTPGRHQFGHALLQEAAYGLLPKTRRSELHVRLAGWLDGREGSDALIGDQLERAHALRAELGILDEDTVQLGADAAARLIAAARMADAMGDPAQARRLLDRALAVVPAGSPGQAVAMVELAAAGWNLLPVEELDRLLTAGADLAATLGLRALELRARILRFGAAFDNADEPVSDADLLASAEAALRELEMLDDGRAVAAALCTMAWIECDLGRAGDAVASVRRALILLRETEQDTVWALSILVAALIESPTPVSVADPLLVLLLADLGMRPTVRSELLQGRAELALMHGDDDEAWALLGAARAIEEDIGRDTSLPTAGLHATMLLRSGRTAEARDELAALVAAYDDRGHETGAAEYRSWLGIAEIRLGNAAAARAAAIA